MIKEFFDAVRGQVKDLGPIRIKQSGVVRFNARFSLGHPHHLQPGTNETMAAEFAGKWMPALETAPNPGAFEWAFDNILMPAISFEMESR